VCSRTKVCEQLSSGLEKSILNMSVNADSTVSVLPQLLVLPVITRGVRRRFGEAKGNKLVETIYAE